MLTLTSLDGQIQQFSTITATTQVTVSNNILSFVVGTSTFYFPINNIVSAVFS